MQRMPVDARGCQKGTEFGGLGGPVSTTITLLFHNISWELYVLWVTLELASRTTVHFIFHRKAAIGNVSEELCFLSFCSLCSFPALCNKGQGSVPPSASTRGEGGGVWVRFI